MRSAHMVFRKQFCFECFLVCSWLTIRMLNHGYGGLLDLGFGAEDWTLEQAKPVFSLQSLKARRF